MHPVLPGRDLFYSGIRHQFINKKLKVGFREPGDRTQTFPSADIFKPNFSHPENSHL